MTNTTPATKPMWKRCDGCKTRIFNEAVDIAAHRALCPYDLRRALQKLTIAFDALKARMDEIAGQVDETAELLTIDPNSVDEEGFEPAADDVLASPDAFADDEEDDLDAIDLPAPAGRI